MKFVAVSACGCFLVALASAAGCANKGWSHCSASKKCGPGIGDCDSNSHCKSGLTCVSSKKGQSLRGSAVDCCQCGALVTSVGGWSACTNDCPCGEGGGDCDSNAQCKGSLVCVSTKNGQHISGSAKDKCEKPCPTVTTVGGWSACTDKCPCNEGGGDCDSDKQCKGSLVCRSTKAGQPLSGSAKDKCEKPCSGPTTVGAWNACTKSKPCCRGGGDCDNDSECAGSLKCVSTISGQPVSGWAKDKCAMPVAVEGDADEAEPVDELAIEGEDAEVAEAIQEEPAEAEAGAEPTEDATVEDEAEVADNVVEQEDEFEME